MTTAPVPKPKLFIGSSKEAKKYAEAIHENLKRAAQVLPWYSGTFQANQYTMESLERRLEQCDFGVFVFSPDDVALMRGKYIFVTRDNTIFEAGLFLGRLSRKRVFCIVPQEIEVSEGELIKGVKIDRYHLLTDLSGITLLTYEYGHDGEYEAATSSACSKIAEAIETESFFVDPTKVLKQRTSIVQLLWEYGRILPITKESTLEERYHALSEAIRLSFVPLPAGECTVSHVALYAKLGTDGMMQVGGNIDKGAFYKFESEKSDEDLPIVIKVQRSGKDWSFTHVQRVENFSLLCYPLSGDHVLSVYLRGNRVLPKETLQSIVDVNAELLTTIELLLGGDLL